MTEDMIPNCPAGTQHPFSDLKKGMAVVFEEGERVIFGCMACLEVNRTQQICLRTLPKGWNRAAYANHERYRVNETLRQQILEKIRTKSGRIRLRKES